MPQLARKAVPFQLYSQLSDCYQGVVFDGLETLFAHNMASALLCLLKAVGNRPHIYVVNLFQDYVSFKARETAAKEQEGETFHLRTSQIFPVKHSALSVCIWVTSRACKKWSY